MPASEDQGGGPEVIDGQMDKWRKKRQRLKLHHQLRHHSSGPDVDRNRLPVSDESYRLARSSESSVAENGLNKKISSVPLLLNSELGISINLDSSSLSLDQDETPVPPTEESTSQNCLTLPMTDLSNSSPNIPLEVPSHQTVPISRLVKYRKR